MNYSSAAAQSFTRRLKCLKSKVFAAYVRGNLIFAVIFLKYLCCGICAAHFKNVGEYARFVVQMHRFAQKL